MIFYQQMQLISKTAFIASQIMEIKFKNSDCFQKSHKFSTCEMTAMASGYTYKLLCFQFLKC